MNNFETIKETIIKYSDSDLLESFLAKVIELALKEKLKDYEGIKQWLLQEVEE